MFGEVGKKILDTRECCFISTAEKLFDYTHHSKTVCLYLVL